MAQADYVVVGAGSAGCAVARRLAESGASVVLIEAGKADDKGLARMLFQTPGAISVMHSTPQLKKLFDWGYKSTPQKHAWDRTIPQTRGKVLGGSSSINGMLFVRGNRKNFDDWADEGCKGWSYDDVLPAFKKLEDWEDGETDLRGAGGPVKITRKHDLTAAAVSFMDAASERLGIPQIPDYNGESQEGVSPFQQSAAGGRRYSSAEGYLRDETARSGRLPLEVLTDAVVTRVVVSGSRATGVEIVTKDGPQVVSAGREVIVSAGVYGSAQILMLSGHRPGRAPARRGRARRGRPPGGRQPPRPPVRADLVPDGLRASAGPRRRTSSANLARERLRPGSTWAAGSSFESVAFTRTSYAREIPDLQLLSLYWVYPVPNQDDPDTRVLPPSTKPGPERLPDADLPREPRHGAAGLARPAGRAAHRPGLPRRPPRHRGARRGHRDGARGHGRRRRQRGRDRSRARATSATPRCAASCRTSCTRSTTRSAPAGWASTSAPWSTPS